MMNINMIIEGFFFKLRHGDIFYSKGVAHPPHSIVSLPKYIINKDGSKISRNGTRYSKLSTLSDQYKYALANYSNYIKFDEFYCRDVVLSPITDVVQIYNPIEKAKELMEVNWYEDNVLKDAQNMILDIITSTKVKDIGISGSILVDLYDKNSDIDIVVYGAKNGIKVYNYLREIIGKDSRYKRYRRDNINTLHMRRSLETPISIKHLLLQESKKVLEGFFNNREYFIRLIKFPWEEPRYSSYRCKKLGKALIRLRVIDASESIYTPCRYRVEVIEYLKGVIAEVVEVYSLRGRFAEIAQEDSVVEAYGTIELVKMYHGEKFYRLYLGDEGDYLITR